jgi:hypothetical protein
LNSKVNCAIIKEKEKGNMKNKINAMIKDKNQRKEFLQEYLVFALQQQNEYIKINDPKEIENLNIVIEYTLKQINDLENSLYELRRDLKGSK